mmetsp:Transcript_17928/g.15836  ORF Transcript_17928/g.15836 Transcript_17928/m.15836 type:complete len:80 (+) Transcript_17928:460-699(+)
METKTLLMKLTLQENKIYRSPERLLRNIKGREGDLWAAGCVMAQLIGRIPILYGDGFIELINMMLEFCGTPTETDIDLL